MNMQKIKSAIDDDFDGFCKDCFAHWITCLWGKYRAEFSYEENREAFFYLVERLLADGRVKFDLPLNDPRQDEFWEDPPEVIVAYIRSQWPAQAIKEVDPAIVDFFYDTQRCPPVSWLGPDGQWHGS